MMNKTTMAKMIAESERRSALPINEDEITEEMIADRLKGELNLFMKGTKSKDKGISKKPADREVHAKKPAKPEGGDKKSDTDGDDKPKKPAPKKPTKSKEE